MAVIAGSRHKFCASGAGDPWWRGRNMGTGDAGEFPADLVYTPSEWAEEEARVQAEFLATEAALKADEVSCEI